MHEQNNPLAAYQSKRKFEETLEPKGTRARAPTLRFVVQKHAAKRLHYDVRLECEGVLKSWAVPKGPSLNPKEKRLAIHVEDHPLDYRTFEGVIPKGNYGAGSVIVWDAGEYAVPGEDTPAAAERSVREGIDKGKISFVLRGKKLNGEFALVKVATDEKSWLLIKKEDRFASQSDVTEKAQSVISGKRVEELSESVLPRKDLIPRQVQPMLAMVADEPFDKEGWIFEYKWDGYRMIAEVTPPEVTLYSRNGRSFDEQFSSIRAELSKLSHNALLDGEVVVIGERGVPDFGTLQQYLKTGTGDVRYYVFDLLHFDGYDMTKVPLARRKEILELLLSKVNLPSVFFSQHVEENGVDLFEEAKSKSIEGVIAKDGRSLYYLGKRSAQWLKVKTHKRQEAIISGFTEGRGSRRAFGALVLGVYEHGTLTYVGHTGGGFDEETLEALLRQLKPLECASSPFGDTPKTNAPVTWVEPKLVCEVKFTEWTRDGHMRHPIFIGMREDVDPSSVVRERASPLTLLTPEDRTDVEIGGKHVSLSNLDKVYWPEDGYTKGDLIEYYRKVVPYILPYLMDRPQSLNRHPNGIAGESFYQKNMGTESVPPEFSTVPVYSESGDKTVHHFVVTDEASLLYLVNLGCIEINPWNSRVASLDRPDYLVLDLDPVEIPFEHVVETALVARHVLQELAVESYCKTSGATGLHVYVPLAARYSYEQARQFAELLARLVHSKIPEFTSLERSPSKRVGRVYLDYLQNRRGQTLAAPYSVRPRKGAPVSTPLLWQEVGSELDPQQFTMKTMHDRLKKHGDLFAPVLEEGIDIEAVLQKLNSLS